MEIRSPVYLALTRPPFIMGVVHPYFYANLILSMMLFLYIGMMIAISFCLIMHGIGVLCSRLDHSFDRVFIGYIKTIFRCKNSAVWRGNSYDPF